MDAKKHFTPLPGVPKKKISDHKTKDLPPQIKKISTVIPYVLGLISLGKQCMKLHTKLHTKFNGHTFRRSNTTIFFFFLLFFFAAFLSMGTLRSQLFPLRVDPNLEVLPFPE